jgi:hypothetical protein
MGADAGGEIERATVEGLAGASGVELTATEVDDVARAVGRIQRSAAALLPPSLFDQSGEHFYRLLDSDAAAEAGR